MHWRAYAWTGNERPPDSDRIDPTHPTPPLEIAHWLRKPGRHVAATSTDPEAAMKWLEAELSEYPEADEENFGSTDKLKIKLNGARDCLRRETDVVFGYYPTAQRYVSRALFACPRPGEQCPAPPQHRPRTEPTPVMPPPPADSSTAGRSPG